MFRLFLLLALITPGMAAAGPWPREVRQTFLSVSVEHNRADNTYASLYGEYGLTPRNTLGLELGRALGSETTAIVWLQRALDGGQGPNRLAMQAGAGSIGTVRSCPSSRAPCPGGAGSSGGAAGG